MPGLTAGELARLFDACGTRLVLYARQWLPRESAEDVAQEAFIQLMNQRESPENPRAWLYTTVRNGAISGLRGKIRRRRREEEVARRREELFAENAASPLAAEEAAGALGALPEEQREVLTLRIWGGLTFGEISAVTRSPVSSVHFKYQAALTAMKSRLEKPCRKDR
jgi:RNA polymerase sigma-70 factor (ECF subfamily)